MANKQDQALARAFKALAAHEAKDPQDSGWYAERADETMRLLRGTNNG